MLDRKSNHDEHTWVEERLSDYIDNQLPPLERVQLERHMQECARCQASLASLKWAISLLKQVPAPALPRSFTLAVPAQPAPAFRLDLGALRLATALATLLLFALVGVDLISQLSGTGAPAPVPAARGFVAPTQAVALAQATPSAPPSVWLTPVAVPPTPAPAQLLVQPRAPATTSLPLPTPTQVSGIGNGAAEMSATKAGVDTAPRLPATLPVPKPAAADARATPTAAVLTSTLAPTRTAIAASPTVLIVSPTRMVQVRVEPTRVPSLPPGELPREIVSPLRIAELGLLFIAVFLGALMVLMRRRR
jgi:hypothetical protein